jgi:hypothetical protein
MKTSIKFTSCQFYVILYELLKSSKYNDFLQSLHHVGNIYIIMLDLCTHVQNNDLKNGLNIGEKMLFQINGLLLFKYIVILMFNKNTKEMLPKWIYMGFFIHLSFVHSTLHSIMTNVIKFNRLDMTNYDYNITFDYVPIL